MSRIGFRAHYNQIITNHRRISHAVHMLYILRHAICICRFHIFMKIGSWVTSVCMCKAQGPVTIVPSVSAKAPCREAWQLRKIITKQVISIHVIPFPQMYKFSSHVGKDGKALSLHLYYSVLFGQWIVHLHLPMTWSHDAPWSHRDGPKDPWVAQLRPRVETPVVMGKRRASQH